jgi:hypothetical protein
MRMLWMFLLCLTGLVAAEPEKVSWEGFVQCGDARGWTAIRSQAEYQAFVDRVPKQRIQMKQPAPPSTDPLLQMPPVDFTRHALVAIWSHNIHIDAKILGTERDGPDLVVHTAYDAPSDYRGYAAHYGYGQYCLVRVDTFPGELKIGQINKKAPDSPPPDQE